MMRDAVALDSEDGVAYGELGLNLIRSGDDAGGVAALSRAFAIDPVQRARLQHVESVRQDDSARVRDGRGVIRRFESATARTSAPSSTVTCRRS